MIPLPTRLRRAIHANDLLLLKRILKNNPLAIRNPDYTDKSNTSLHLACKLGCLDIVAWLIEAGHEDEGISLNTDFETPLMVACEAKQVDVGKLLIATFPECVGWSCKGGMDALMLSSRNGTLPLLSLLLTSTSPNTNTPLASPLAHDKDGNTALHYASASGELKALRLLLQYNASPHAQNAYSWTPIAYSATTAAEAYFKQLVAEFEIRRVAAVKASQDKERARGGGGVRLVTGTDELAAATAGFGEQRSGGGTPTPTTSTADGSGRAGSAAGFTTRNRLDSFGTLAERMEWSPVGPRLERNAMTPTEQKGGFDFGVEARRRAGSGD